MGLVASVEPAAAFTPAEDTDWRTDGDWIAEPEPALVLAMLPQPTTEAPPPEPIEQPEDEPASVALDLLRRAPREPAAPPGQSVDSAAPGVGPVNNVNITFYDCADQGFCRHMYNGEWVYEGAAACSWNLPLGTAFYVEDDPTQRIYVCKDRGLLDDTWVDIFWYHPDDGYDWQAHVGRHGTIHIVYMPQLPTEGRLGPFTRGSVSWLR